MRGPHGCVDEMPWCSSPRLAAASPSSG